MKVEINDEVWKIFRKACAVNSIKSRSDAVRLLNFMIEGDARDWLRDADNSEPRSHDPKGVRGLLDSL